MVLKYVFVVIMVMRILDSCWSTKHQTNFAEQRPVELSCHHAMYQNGKHLGKIGLYFRPQTENLINFELSSNRDLESALVCDDGNDTFRVASFRIRGEIISCICMTKFCMLGGAMIEASCGGNCWKSMDTRFQHHSEYLKITTKMDLDRDMEGLYRCQLVLRDEPSNNFLFKYKWIWMGVGTGLLIVIILAIALVHATKILQSPESPEQE